jgi:hypothetical protein
VDGIWRNRCGAITRWGDGTCAGRVSPNINPYGTFRLDMNKRLDLSGVTISGQRAAVSERAEANPAPR